MIVRKQKPKHKSVGGQADLDFDVNAFKKEKRVTFCLDQNIVIGDEPPKVQNFLKRNIDRIKEMKKELNQSPVKVKDLAKNADKENKLNFS